MVRAMKIKLKNILILTLSIYSTVVFANSPSDQNLMMHIFNLHSVNKRVSDQDCKTAYQGQSDAPPLIAQKNGRLVMGSFSFWGGTETQKKLGNDLILIKGHSKEYGVLPRHAKPIQGT